MKRTRCVHILAVLLLVGCGQQRPDGPEVREFVEHLNRVSRPLPKGNPNEFYALLSLDFIARFEAEIEKAKKLDSASVRALPKAEMLRVLSLKNALAEAVRKGDTRSVILNWFSSAGKGFPAKTADQFYYTPKASVESKVLEDGAHFPQVLITKEDGKLKVDPFNTSTFQNRRLENILEKTSWEDLMRDAAWLHYQSHRKIHWGPL